MKRPPGILLPALGVLGGLALVVALAILFLVNRSRADLAAYKAELEQRGETFDVTRLAPPAPPAEDNGADALVAAGEALKAAVAKNSIKPYRTGQMETTPGQAEVLHRRHAALRLSKDTSWEDFHKEMEPLRPLLAKIRNGAQAPVLEIHPEYTLGFSMPLPFLTPFLSSGQFLAAESLLLLRDGNAAMAGENIETTLRIAGVANRQPLLISRLVAISIAGICQATTWEFLQAKSTPEEIQKVQNAWESFSLIDGVPDILRMERACAVAAYASPLETLKTIASFSPASPSSFPFLDQYGESIEWELWSVIFRESDERYFITYYQNLLDHLKGGDNWKETLSLAQSQWDSLAEAGISRKMSKLSVPAINDALARLVGQAATQSLTITAIAIRRYQMDHASQPPDALTDLVPSYLSAVPLDPMNGEPIRYQRKGEQYLLYTVGENGADDGGNPETPAGKRRRGLADGLDIVWPQAVTPSPTGRDPETPRE